MARRPETKRSGIASPWLLRLLAALTASLLTFASASALGTGPASAVTSGSCGFADAGTGTYASTLCWLDLSAYDPSAATGAGQAFSESIPGGYTLTFTLTASGGPVAAVPLPTYSNAYLGNNGFYTGVPGSPALYQTTAATTTTATLTNISVTDSSGQDVSGYSLVGADAESTSQNEWITWTSTSPLTSLTATSTGNGLGNACGGGFTGVGTTTVTCTGVDSKIRTGTPILASTAPTTFTQVMKGGGLEGVAFGVLVSEVSLSKSVVNGFAGDSFGIAIKGSSGSTLAAADTNGGTTASTGRRTVIVAAGGSDFTLTEAATAGTLSNYAVSWSCTRNGMSDPTLPSGAAGVSATVTANIGDEVECTITNTARPASLSLVKHAGVPVDVNGDGLVSAGDTIQYTFTVSNTGDLVLNDIAVSDAKIGSVSCPQPTLAPGDTETCSADADYTITAADQAAGAVENSATASGVPEGATATIGSSPSSTSTPVTAPSPGLSLVKSVMLSDPSAFTAGEPVTYSFVVKNTGNVALSAVTVREGSFTGTGPLGPVVCPIGSDLLAVGAEAVCTADYTLTQADVDAGTVTNTADATGTAPGGNPVASPPSSATAPFPPAPGVALVKSVSPGTATAAGDTVTYSFAVTNTGNVSLSAPQIVDDPFSGTGGLPAVSCPAGAFPPGDTVTCTASYTMTQADVDAGSLTNTATATATASNGTDPVSAPSSASVSLPAAPGLELVKSAVIAGAGIAGEVVTYSFTATNTGNVTLTDLTVTEGAFTGTGTLGPISCPSSAASVAPGESVTCTAGYTLTQPDVDAGQVANSAAASATPPGGGTAIESPPAHSTTPTDRAAALTLLKSATPATISGAGEPIGYSYLVTNTGTVTLLAPTIAETSFSGAGSPPAPTCPGDALAPAASVTCTATYTTTQADVDAGQLTNTAIATATAPAGVPSPVSPESTATVTTDAAPNLTLVKSADVATYTAPGQRVTYGFLVTNTGNVTLSGITINEVSFSGTGRPVPQAECPRTSLAPGTSEACSAPYIVTQADIDAGTLVNVATVAGTPPGARTAVPSDPSELTIHATHEPALTLVKSVSPLPPGGFRVGQSLTFAFVITNVGNATLTGITVDDASFTGTGTLPAPICPAGAAALAPFADIVCTSRYTLTQADIDSSHVTNTATATGTLPADGSFIRSGPSTVIVPDLAALLQLCSKPPTPPG